MMSERLDVYDWYESMNLKKQFLISRDRDVLIKKQQF